MPATRSGTGIAGSQLRNTNPTSRSLHVATASLPPVSGGLSCPGQVFYCGRIQPDFVVQGIHLYIRSLCLHLLVNMYMHFGWNDV